MRRLITTLKSLLNRKSVRRSAKRKYRLNLEILEDRCLLSAIKWTGGVDSTWNEQNNWTFVNDATTHQVPGTGDDVTIAPTAGNKLILTGQAEVKSFKVDNGGFLDQGQRA